MTSGETLAELERLGVVLEPNGDKLRYRAPQGALTPELREAITENKAEIISTLRRLGDGQTPPLDRHHKRNRSYGGGWTTQPSPKPSTGGWSGP